MSRVTLDQFVYVGEANGQKMAVNLAKGVFRFTTGKLDKNAYIISTPSAAIGVRGTVLDIGVQKAQSKVTLVEGQALVCPRRPGTTFAQQIRNCTRAAGGPGGPRCECVDLNNAGQTALVKRSGGTNSGELDVHAGQFRRELRRRRRALLGQHLCIRRHSGRGRRLSSRGPMRTMRPEPARRAFWLLASTSAAALVCWSGAAVADCTGTALVNIQASGSSSCFVSGPFTSTVAGVIAGRATGLGSALTNEGGEGFSSFSFSTSGDNTPAVQADSGGLVTLNATTSTGTVTTIGVGSIGLLATGLGESETPAPSQITVEGVTVSTSGAAVSGGPTANGIEADNGAMAIITNGSVTTAATANGAVGVAATGGSQITISGTTITSNGDGSQGLFVTGSGSSLTGSGLNVTANGNNDPVTGFNSGAASNNAFDDEFSTGGKLSISVSTLTTTGTQSFGIFTADKGVTTLTDDAVTTKGDNAFAGVESARGGQTTITRGSVSTSGIGSPALLATGAGSSITATGVAVTTSGNFDPSTKSASNGLDAVDRATAAFSGGSINTAGNAAYAVVANSGGLVSLNGTTIGTTGNGSGGLGINGAGSEIDATGVTITTTGAYDPVSGEHSYGVYNGPYGSFPAGGVAKLTDASISTQGVQMYGVITNAGATTSILSGSIATAGTQANGVLAENSGTVTIGVSNSKAGATSVVTSGTSAPGIVAYVGGAVQITGATIATNGDGSSGLSLNGAGSSITATGISVTTSRRRRYGHGQSRRRRL